MRPIQHSNDHLIEQLNKMQLEIKKLNIQINALEKLNQPQLFTAIIDELKPKLEKINQEDQSKQTLRGHVI